MSIKRIQTNVIIGEGEDLFFKEVEFDFQDVIHCQCEPTLPSPILPTTLPFPMPPMPITPVTVPCGAIYMIENITEKVEAVGYSTDYDVVMFNAWITKNIAYKYVNKPCQSIGCQESGSCQCKGSQPVQGAYLDAQGNPTVSGPINHVTKVINFGGLIKIKLPRGEKLRKSDKVEVLEAEVVATNNELLGPIEIVEVNTCNHFSPRIYEYKKLREKMCIRLKVKVVRMEHLNVVVEDEWIDCEYEVD